MGQERQPKITVTSWNWRRPSSKNENLVAIYHDTGKQKFLVVSTGKKCIIVVDAKNSSTC